MFSLFSIISFKSVPINIDPKISLALSATTKYPITGPTRGNSIFCIAKYKGKKISKNFKNLIKNGKKETFEDFEYKLKYYDYLANANPGKNLYK